MKEVYDKNLSNKSPSSEARLDPNSQPGKLEKAAVDRLLYSTIEFRITNSMALGVQGGSHVKAIHEKFQHSIGDFKSLPPLHAEGVTIDALYDREQQFVEFASTAADSLLMAQEGLAEVTRCVGDLFNMQAHNYINAAAERRRRGFHSLEVLPPPPRWPIELANATR